MIDRDVDIIRSHGAFDTEYYSLKYPDVAREGFNPIHHYCEHGWKEGRNPSADFNTFYYKNANPDVSASGMNPLVHWILHGHREGRPTTPSYSQPKLSSKPAGAINKSVDLSLRDETHNHKIIMESSQFDQEYYLKNNPDVIKSGIEPIDHFCRFGWREGRNPSSKFHTRFYLEENPDVSAGNINPFVHWLLYGRNEGRAGTPDIHHDNDGKFAGRPFNPSVIFVSHEASRTGAPMVLLSMLRWIKENTDIEFGIVIGADGPLREDFKALAPCMFMDAYPHEERRGILRQFCGVNVQCVYLNTIVSGIYGAYLTFLNAEFITHVHEMENLFVLYEETFSTLMTFCSKYIAVSQGSVEAIEKRTAHRNDVEISYIAPFIDRYHARNVSPLPNSLQQDRDIPVIYGCGTLEARKGPDIFCDVAEILRKEGITDFRMKWIGGQASWDLAEEIQKRDIGANVEWLGAQADPRRLLKDGAMFVLPSREDAFPLVCLEAAEQGLPVICFDHRAGSMHKFVENDAGIVVDYLDAQEMAQAIKTLLQDVPYRKALGARAKEKMESRHLTDTVCPQIMALLPALSPSTATNEFEAYKEQIDRADIVSFDIFDTLITRRLSNPSTVFDVVEHRHSSNQAAVLGLFDERMRVAGAVLAKQQGKRDDVDIDEIYQDMPFFRNSQIEKAVEIDVVVPHPLGFRLYDYALKAGKHVIIVSDMYLDEDTIVAMMGRCGITQWNKLFLSSKMGLKKDTGRLFQKVVEYAGGAGIDACRMLHIGDNWEGDVHKAKAAGLKAIRFVPLYDKPHRRFPIAPEQALKLSQIGRIWNDFTTQATKLWKEKNRGIVDDFYMTLGFELSGPLAAMMAMYVRSQADKLGISKIVFMARDGRIIKKAFETLYRDDIAKGRYEVLYAHLSRAVVIPATLQDPLSSSDLYFLIEGLHLGQKPIRYFFRKANLDDKDPEIIKRVEARFPGMDTVPTWADLLSLTSLMNECSAHIYKANEPEREKFAAYLARMGIDRDEKIVMVDVGWLLNIQSRFHQFCRDFAIPEQVIGIYVGSRDRVDKSIPHFSLLFDGGDPKHYADMIEENTTLFEILFSAPEPSASGLIWDEAGDVEVALKPLAMPRSKEFEVARKIHFGAEAFFGEMATALKTFMPARISKDFFLAAFEALVYSTDADAHAEFGNFEVLLGGHHEFVAHQNLLKAEPASASRRKIKDEYFAPLELGYDGDQGVAIITSAGLDNGSTRYRGMNLGHSLNTMGIRSTLFHAATDIDMFELEMARFDTVLFQRCFKEQGNVGRMYDVARRLGKRCVMEIDDLVFPEFLPVIGSVVGGEWSYDEALYVSSAYESMMNDMDGAIASTDVIRNYLADKWKFPTAVYRNRVWKIGAPVARTDPTFRMIYASGTYSHKEDFEIISKILVYILKKYPHVSLSLLGSTQVPDKLLSFPNVSTYPILPYDEMLSFIGSHDLMLVPLADSIFNDAKSNVKFIECASMGVPVIASGVREYDLAITDGVNGLIAEDSRDWEVKLDRILKGNISIFEIGDTAKKYVKDHYLCSTIDDETSQTLRKALFGV
ncbi:MAG: glycosyltransferase [Sphingobium sp.]|nr:glycosyltransferase [Sphingobium sp.]